MSVTKLTGKRDTWYTYNSKLYREDESVFCEAKFKRFTEQGTLVIPGIEGVLTVKHKTGSGKWYLLKANTEDETNEENVLMSADKPKAGRTRLFIKGMKEKVILQTRSKGSQNCDLYKADFESDDVVEGDKPDGDLLASFTSKILKLNFDVETFDPEISQPLFAFVFFMFIVMYRRRSQEAGAYGMY